MPNLVEIDETALLAKNRVVSTVNAMLAHPDARKLVHQAEKIINPKAVIPEYDAKSEVLEEIGKINKRLDEEAAARTKADEEREANAKLLEFQGRWDAGKQALRGAGYTDEAIGEIEKLAKERGIADFDAAAALFDRLHPPAMPASGNSFGNWSLFEPSSNENDGKFLKRLIETRGDDDVALQAEINQTLADVRGQSPQRRAA